MRFAELVEDELARSRSEHRPMASAHEALSVIWEEMEEFKAEVFRKPAARSPEQMISELVQARLQAVACTCWFDIFSCLEGRDDPRPILLQLPHQHHGIEFSGRYILVNAQGSSRAGRLTG